MHSSNVSWVGPSLVYGPICRDFPGADFDRGFFNLDGEMGHVH